MIYRPHVEGKANVPKTGPIIFASNHLSFIDSIAIPVAAPRPVHFLAKSSYFDGPGFSGWFSRQFFTAIGAVPVQRGAGQAALDALDQQRQLLVAGNAVALYPEGTRSLDGRLYKGRTGVAFLALQSGAPVVPVGLIGTDTVMPVGARFPSLRQRVTVQVRRAARSRPPRPGGIGQGPAARDRRHHGGHPRALGSGTREHLQRGTRAQPDRAHQAGPPARAAVGLSRSVATTIVGSCRTGKFTELAMKHHS